MDDFLSVLPAIIFWTAVVILIKRGQKIRPRNNAQRKLVDDVIAAIERSAPDFDGADVYWADKISGSTGGVGFRSLSGYKYFYGFAPHGYFVEQGMAHVLASEIAKHFGGKYYISRDLYHDYFTHYEVKGPHQLAAEQQKKHRFDNLQHL